MTECASSELPPIAVFCPIPAAIHPSAASIESASIQWLASYDYFGGSDCRPRLIGTKSAEFAARVAPEGSAERLRIASDWDYWGFAFDDRTDNDSQAADVAGFVCYAHAMIRTLEAPGTTVLDDDPLVVAIADISARFAACVTPFQHRRWIQAHRAWLFGVAAQLGGPPMVDLDRYLTIRVNDAAGEVVTVSSELVGGYELSGDALEQPAVRALTEMSRLLAALDNDLHSYAKTLARQESNQLNIVAVIAFGEHCSISTAAELAVGLRDRIMCRFLELSAQVRLYGSSAVRCYVRDLGHVIRGNIDWALNVPRYSVAGRPVAERFAVTEVPADSSPHPPGISSIDWWWRV